MAAQSARLLLGSLLFLGVIVTLAFPAFYCAAPVDGSAIVFILVMGLICFVPLALYGRGIAKSERNS